MLKIKGYQLMLVKYKLKKKVLIKLHETFMMSNVKSNFKFLEPVKLKLFQKTQTIK